MGIIIDPSASLPDPNVSSALVDVLYGDNDAYKKILQTIDMPKIKLALDFLLNNPNLNDSQKADLATNSWRLYYRARPPTPAEFLTTKYLGRMGEPGEIYPHVRKWFLEFFDTSEPYRNLVLYSFIGSGKSTCSVLINLYMSTLVSLLRDPKKFFGLAPSTVLACVLCSYSLKKSSEVLLEPFLNLLECSDFFVKQRTKADMIGSESTYQRMDSPDHIFWTTASTQGTSALSFSNGMNVKLISSVHNLLGLSIVCGTMTELAFFRDAGKSDDWIMRFFNDLKYRIESRMKGGYFGRSILDSSPNDLESPIDHYCIYEARKDPTNYVVSGSRWQWIPTEFEGAPLFPVFKGGMGKPPTVLTSADGYAPEDIVWVPDRGRMKQAFIDDCRKALKDQAGIPSGNIDKLIYEQQRIEECFHPDLKNIYGCLQADAKQSPTHLLWNQIKDQFFVKVGDRYRFYYKPTLPRTFHIDQAVSGDMASIAFCHVERRKDSFDSLDPVKDLVYVIDFVVPIHPYGGRINLDAIRDLIIDVMVEGHLPLSYGSFDTYQSETNIQHLARYGIEMEALSVDKSIDPYMFLIQLIETGNLKVGKNIFLKNNIRSLRMTRRRDTHTPKVDHTLGDIIAPAGADTRWESSFLGLNAKDVSDSVCGAVQLAKKYFALNPMALGAKWDETRIILSPEQVKKETTDFMVNTGLTLS